MSRHRFIPRSYYDTPTAPFVNAEEAWFWFVQCFQARREGARIQAGCGDTTRPCDPDDVLAVVNRLYRKRRLLREHLLVLTEYGEKLLPPDAAYPREARAAFLWQEALDRLAHVLRRKGIVQ